MRRRLLDGALVASTVVLAVVALVFGLRYGDAYRVGDTSFHRTSTLDAARVVVPLGVMAIPAFVLTVRRLNPDGVRAQWRRERQELRAAKVFLEVRPSGSHDPFDP